MPAFGVHITHSLTVITLVGISDIAGDRDDGGDRGDWSTGPATEA